MSDNIKEYIGLTLDEERALYNLHNARIEKCLFDGPADGESAIKECSKLEIKDCDFRLRYPLWHLSDSTLLDCKMNEDCRAALWYDRNIDIQNSYLGGIKALRECDNTYMDNCEINSVEFGWLCRDVIIKNSTLQSEYPFFMSKSLKIQKLNMKGKYSFQYIEDCVIENSYLDTKDAFWHGKNITVRNSVVKGEYLAWYSENITFENCKIIGTQPLCYAKNLVLKNCEMTDCDLSFERSEVNAKINGDILSVKNPIGGCIEADSIGEIIIDDYIPSGACKIIQLNK